MTKITLETLKKHLPRCAEIFDQIASVKASEAEYKTTYGPEVQAMHDRMMKQLNGAEPMNED
jgi:hypothetical protein